MSGTRWLTRDEQVAWRAFLEASARLLEAVDAQLTREAGMSHADYEILVRLSEAPDRRQRMSELAERLLFSRSRLSHAVTRLERVGWVRRESTPGDGRGTLAVLTEDGFTALAAAAPGHVEAVRSQLFDLLTPEQVEQLAEIGRTLSAPKR